MVERKNLDFSQGNLKKLAARRIVFTAALAFYIQILLRIWRNLDSMVNAGFVSQILQPVIHPNGRLIVGAFIVLVCIQCVCWNREAQVISFIYRHRLLLSVAAVALLVLFDISGSSIHMISYYTPSEANGVLLGMARPIRSDEWAMITPMSFSQAASGFPYFSTVLRGSKTDAFIVTGYPVWDYAVIFRPFNWGFLLLGGSRGLSFFWWSRLFALLLVSFEFGMMLTNNQKKYAALFSFMLTFSPFVQWWFAAGGVVEMFVFGMGAVLLFRKYLQTESYRVRLFLALLISVFGCIYILTFYPAWMVPIAYIYLCFIIWIAYENRTCSLCLKRDGLILVIAVLFMVCNLAYVFLKSREAIAITMNTAYPGKRRGDSVMPVDTLFYYITNFFTPLKNGIPGTNESECSAFISFFPLGLVLFLYNSYRKHRADLLSLLLIAISVLFALYTFVDLPPIVDAVTLMQYSIPVRVLPILMLVQFILLFREIASMNHAVNRWFALMVAASIAFVSGWRANLLAPGYLTIAKLTVAVVVIFVCCLTLMRAKEKRGMARLAAFVLSSVIFFSGVLVNPIQKGTKEITDNQITKIAQPIAQKDPEALWIVEGAGYPYTNFLIPVGIPTINSTNVYPNLERWHLLDEAGEYENIYNRYAHILISLTNSPTYFEKGATVDAFSVQLNPADLKTLDVGYIYTKRDLSEYSNGAVELVLLDQMDDDRVYQVVYP